MTVENRLTKKCALVLTECYFSPILIKIVICQKKVTKNFEFHELRPSKLLFGSVMETR